MSDLMAWCVFSPFIGLCLGFIIGGRMTDGYWADHGKNGGSVHHNGKFYKITLEKGSRG